MSTLAWVLAGIVAYWLAVVVLRSRGLFPEYVRAQGPLLTLHTTRGRILLDRLSAPRRFWRAWGNFGVGIALVVMALSFLFLVLAAISQMLQPEPSAVTRPQNIVVIPGVNEFLPLSVAPEILAGLLVGLVVHEGGHGLLCRVEDIDIESMGLVLFALVPIGAFVEPDDDSRRAADRGSQTRMFAAGVTNNFLVTAIAFGLLFGPVTASIAVADGVHVGGTIQGSAAEQAGIERGDRIVAVDGRAVGDDRGLDGVLAGTTDRTVGVDLAGGCETDPDRACEVDVERSAYVVGVVPSAPPDVAREEVIVSVNGTPVSTERELAREFRNRTVATVETANGTTTTFPVGAYATVDPEGPLAAAGAPGGEQVVVTRIGDERVIDHESLSGAMAGTEAGQTVTVETYRDGGRETYEVTLGDGGDRGRLGVAVAPGYTGVVVDDFGVETYPSDLYLGVLGGGAGGDVSPIVRTSLVLVLPVAGVSGGGIQGLPFNFAGFTGGVEHFYVPTGPLAFLGRWLFLVANLLFWTGWINFNLALFNCIPGFPLDGGHILRNATEAVVSRLPVEHGRRATRLVTTTVGMTMLLSLGLMLFGQGLLVR